MHGEPDLCASCGNQFPPGHVCDLCRKTYTETEAWQVFFAGLAIGLLLASGIVLAAKLW